MRINELWRKAQEHVKADALPVPPDEVALELYRAADDSAISGTDYRAKSRQLLAPWGEAVRRAHTSRAPMLALAGEGQIQELAGGIGQKP
jgi:hypothetical protein